MFIVFNMGREYMKRLKERIRRQEMQKKRLKYRYEDEKDAMHEKDSSDNGGY